MMFLLLSSLLLIIFIWLCIQMENLKRSAKGITGPPTTPIFGNILDLGTNNEEMTKRIYNIAKKYSSPIRLCIGPFRLVVGLQDPDEFQVVLSSTKILNKGKFYDLTKIWLKEGLITASGEHWHQHRKILTPAFHFQILERFVEVFGVKSENLVNFLNKHVDQVIDITEPIARCALDIITETAMGVSLDIQRNDESEYVHNVKEVSRMIFERAIRPWLYNDFIYGLTPSGRNCKRRLQELHGFTRKVIKTRREKFEKEKNSKEEDDIGRKKKLAFLDLLLDIQKKDTNFTDSDIQEETDTFMFAGHDTTSTAISFCLYNISKNPHVQDSIVEELETIFGGDSSRTASFHDLQEMHYLERVIKESMRLCPSIPAIIRYAEEEIVLRENVIIPKGTEVGLLLMSVHHNNKYWPAPLKFDPDRFLPERSIERHPFAYVPFSAGPRNCIGQKFAMLEMKMVISTLLRQFQLGDVEQTLKIVNEIVLKSKNGIKVKLQHRQNTKNVGEEENSKIKKFNLN